VIVQLQRALVCAIVSLCAVVGGSREAAGQAVAPASDSVGAADTITDRGVSMLTRSRRSRLAISSGKTYNRIEGLAVHLGPVFSDTVGPLLVGIDLFGILRSADTFRWDGANVGHLARTEIRSLGPRAVGLTLSAYDIVDAVEDWQMPKGEAGLAAFLFHRDYRDHLGRHGGSGTATFYAGSRTRVELSLADERWSSGGVRQVLTLLRNNHAWRANPVVDDGHARLATVRAQVDTRNDPRLPWYGWLATAEYERGSATLDQLGPTSPVARLAAPSRTRYGRLLMDVRRYNRISPETQLNLRLVAGGWLHGDELPLQRRVSVGGPATIPGVDFRDVLGTDVGMCSDTLLPAGAPAQCERVLLLQAEYRDELPFRPGTIFGGTPIRIRSAALTLRPTLVVFADVGRGWLLPPRGGAAPAAPPRELVYSTRRIPPLETFRTDVGLGVDLGLFGVYVAKSVSEGSEAANVILRARGRF
jgi:hypothetical protein